MIGQLLKERGAIRKQESEFPINNDEELARVEKNIENGDRDSYVRY